ncbi:MAG TPA: carboxymuconolactone decarboxylase family protein [Anaeromyxobacteraceae bacterium]|nr:carboxymuconolactone decarboxylase family protein [Anaeromyxobacteraceae bacterium]
MSRIPVVVPSAAGEARPLLEAIGKSLGITPNLYRVVAHSPAALAGVLELTKALAKGRLGGRVREQLALAVAQANHCDYCLSAHTAIGRSMKVPDAELELARQGRASDPRAEAALRFALRVLESRGGVDDADVTDARRAGLDDGQLVEIVAEVALNVFTNYLNKVAKTEIDFPVVRADETRAA